MVKTLKPPFSKVTTTGGVAAWVPTHAYTAARAGLRHVSVRLLSEMSADYPAWYTPRVGDLEVSGTLQGRRCIRVLGAEDEGVATAANFEWKQRRAKIRRDREMKP